MSTTSHVETQNQLHALIEAAVLAPSPDNNQPWQFAVEGERLVVHLDRRQALPSDVNGMFDLMGVGAAIENACLAARHRGLYPEVEIFDPPRQTGDDPLVPVATVALRPGGVPDPLFSQLADRCTNRKPYATRPVDKQSLQRLADAASAFPGIQLDFVTDRSRICALARLAGATDLVRFQYEPFHNEMFRQLRFSAEEAERTGDGLDVRTVELPPGAAWILRLLRPWKRMQWLHRTGLSRLLSVPSILTARHSGALGVLTADEATVRRFMHGGRSFQRIWLAAQAEGLAMHPLGSPAVFFGHIEQLDGRKLSRAHQRRLAALIERFTRLLPQKSGRTLLMLFRLGYAAGPSARSLRRRVEDALIRQGEPHCMEESPTA